MAFLSYGALRDMNEITMSKYYEATVLIQQVVHTASGINPSDEMAPGHRNSSIGMLDKVKAAIGDMPLPVTKLTLEELQQQLNWFQQKMTFFACGQLLVNLSETMRRELTAIKAFTLDPRQNDMYDPKEPIFGTDIAVKFGASTFDINEAAKCIALSRPTAAVFHLMHVIERALRAVHMCLSLPIPDNPTWGIWLSQIREERIKRGDRKWSESAFFQDIWQHLNSIKDAQRDPTMHVESIHTESEAMLIFDNTKALMKKIASKMDQNGEPKV